MAGIRFYERWDGGLLVRVRHERAVPEVYRGKTNSWEPFPMFDPMHKDEPIDAERALELAYSERGAVVRMSDLEALADDPVRDE